MIRSYRDIATVSIGIAVVTFGAVVFFGQDSSTYNVWGPGGAPPVLASIIGFAILIFFWAFAKAKGRSGWVGILLLLLSFIGLIILLALKDKSHSESSENASS